MFGKSLIRGWFFSADTPPGNGGNGSDGKTPPGGGAGGAGESGGDGQKVDFKAFLESQPENIRQAYEESTKGLKSALDKERSGREAMEKQLREAAKRSGEKDPETQKALTDMADRLAETQRQLDFYHEASGKDVIDVELAYTAAIKADLVNAKGRVDWEGLKERYPALFAKPAPAGSSRGGAGTQGPAGEVDMNVAIRRAMGQRI